MDAVVESKKRKSPNWTSNEVTTFLDLMIENNVMSLFDDKKTRTIEIYRMISDKMQDVGNQRDPDQLKIKFTKLKGDFMRIRMNNNTSGAARLDDPFYDKMSTLLSKRPVVAFQNSGYDTSQPSTSEQEASSELDFPEVTPVTPVTPQTDTETSELETETADKETPKLKRQRTSYRAVVASVTEDLQRAMAEQTDKTLEDLKEMQEEDNRFMKEMQEKDQRFLLELFNLSQTPQNQVVFMQSPFNGP